MRHLIVCCDGTWNSAEQAHDGVPTPTNVRMFHNLLADDAQDGNPQVAQSNFAQGQSQKRELALIEPLKMRGKKSAGQSAECPFARTVYPE